MKFQFPTRTIALVFGLALAATATSHADSFFLRLKGQKGGDVKGSVTLKGFEGSIQELDFEHLIVSPRDSQTGLPTGQRQHKVLAITIPLDQTAPLLLNIMCTNEMLSDFNLTTVPTQTRAASGVGSGNLRYTTRLTNASIASIEHITKADANGANPKVYLKISFSYQKIEWTWSDGGITAMDDWEARI